MKHISIDKLNEHLFETIEMLKNNSDENASPNEKIDVDTAQTIASLGKVVVEGYKVKVQVLNMMRNTENPNTIKTLAEAGGFILEEKAKSIEQ